MQYIEVKIPVTVAKTVADAIEVGLEGIEDQNTYKAVQSVADNINVQASQLRSDILQLADKLRGE